MDNKLVTMLVNGVEWTAEENTPNAEYYYTEKLQKNPANCGGPDLKPYRTALYIDKDGINNDLSVPQAVQGGTFSEKSAHGITVVSHSDDFSALMLVGTDYTITDSNFRFITEGRGKNVNDFNGYGAVIGVYKGAKLTLENVYLESEGVAKPSVYCFHQSDVLLKDCVSRVMGGKLYDGYVNSANPSRMIAPPWVLGITGNARGTNLTGVKSSMTAVDCLMQASQWGVMSTDMGSEMLLAAVDSDLVLLGKSPVDSDYNDPYSTRYGSGYGTYAIGKAQEDFYGTHFKVGTYATILTGGNCTYRSSKGTIKIVSPSTGEVVYEGQGKGRVTEVDSDAFGFMAHDVGSLTLIENTVVRSKCASFLIKAGGVVVNVEDGTELMPVDNVILQMIDNDDTLTGADISPAGVAFKTEYHEPEGWPSENGNISSKMEKKPAQGPGGPGEGPGMPGGPGEGPGGPGMPGMPGGGDDDDPPMAAPQEPNTDPFVRFNASNVSLKGSLYNGTGYYGEEARKLVVTLGAGASLEGGISATETIHVNEKGEHNTFFTIKQFYYLGHVANRNFFNGDNDVFVELADGAVWRVTEEGVITKLTVGAGCVFEGKVFKDGQQLQIVPGEVYEGEMKVVPQD